MQVPALLLCLCALVVTASGQAGTIASAATTSSLLTATQLANSMTSAMKSAPAVAAASGELPITTLTKALGMPANFGTGKDLAAISNYYSKLAINDNNFIRNRGNLFTEGIIVLSTANIAVSLGGFVASLLTLTKDTINLVVGGLVIATSSISLANQLPSGPTPGMTQAAIDANIAANSNNGRRLQGNGSHHAKPAAYGAMGASYPTLDPTAASPADSAATDAMFAAFSKQAFENGGNGIDIYCTIMQQVARIDMMMGSMQTVQKILEHPETAFDGITANNHTSHFTPEALANVNMMQMGAGLIPSGGNYSACPAIEEVASLGVSDKKKSPTIHPKDALYFSNDQLAINQSNYNILKSLPTILIFPRDLPGQPNFIGTGITPVQKMNLAFTATVINFIGAIFSELSNLVGLLADTITFLLRFPGLAIQIAQLEISAGVFETTLERDFTPGGAAYSDLQRFITAVDGYRATLGQGSMLSAVTDANKQLASARAMLATSMAPAPKA